MAFIDDSRILLLIIVYIGLFLDYILMSVVVPILPEYLLRITYPNDIDLLFNRDPNNLTDKEAAYRRECIRESGVSFSILYGVKACLQLLTNPIVGPLTNRIGSSLPLFVGFSIMTGSTVVFALGTNFPILLVARALQGIGSACTATGGMSLLARIYTEEEERSRAMGIALGAIALGDLLGPPYGGTLYQYTGKEIPFLLLAVLGAIGGTMQLFLLPPKLEHIEKEEDKPSSLKALLIDPYITITLFGIFFAYLGWSAIQSALPVWLIDNYGASSMERGLIYLPCSFMYLCGTSFFGPVAYKLGRWLAAFVGLILMGVAEFFIPSVPGLYFLALPFVLIGIMIAIVDASLYPMLSYLVEIRHQNVFGAIYAMADAVYCISSVIGPFTAGQSVNWIGFEHTAQIGGMITLASAPLMLILRDPPITNQKKLSMISAKLFAATTPELSIVEKEFTSQQIEYQ